MKDAEIQRLFDRVENSLIDLRRHVDTSAAETREQLRAEMNANAAELRQEMKSTAAELRADFQSTAADMRHQYEIRTERLEDKIQLVVEAVALLDEKVDRLHESTQEDMRRGFADTHDLIQFGYSSLDRRVTTLESKVTNLGG